MKICTACNARKNIDCFYTQSACNDGLMYECIPCYKSRIKEYSLTRNGLISKIYGNQKYNSIKRKHSLPSYTLRELREWVISNSCFSELYDNWVSSGFHKNKTPSVDRIDSSKPYSLLNIQLITWLENKNNGHIDRRVGIDNSISKAVAQYTKDGLLVDTFHSMHEANRRTGCAVSSISLCSRGKVKYANGYVWRLH